ncbi:MAG TPA: sulfite exporter TauE/SafE family protein [Methylomirabilota bacterium]|jgi:uncharacterized membrane protein YfcA|nr:sulfite exporter TauE/SafE family protein [Methylomirabilota bacterium]
MGTDALIWAAGLAGVAVAAFVKGAVGFGYPLIATPLLAFATDVRTAVAVLVIPNILMDGIQMVRRPGLVAALRRHAPLLVMGILGTVAGTQFLAVLSTRGLLLTLGATLVVFVILSVSRPAWRVTPGSERLLAPVVGLAAGTLGGLTNAPSVVLTPYYYAIGLPKTEFVRAISATFLVFKLTQLGAVWQVGLIDRRVLLPWLAAAGVSLAAFRLGLRAQDRVPQAAFNRAVLVLLTVVAVAMLVRGFRS